MDGFYGVGDVDTEKFFSKVPDTEAGQKTCDTDVKNAQTENLLDAVILIPSSVM